MSMDRHNLMSIKLLDKGDNHPLSETDMQFLLSLQLEDHSTTVRT